MSRSRSIQSPSPRPAPLALAFASALLALPFAAALGVTRHGEARGTGQRQPVPVPQPVGIAEVQALLHGIERGLTRLEAKGAPQVDDELGQSDEEPTLRELLIHGRELFRKSDRLARERGQPGYEPPPLPAREPTYADVATAVAGARERLAVVRPEARPRGIRAKDDAAAAPSAEELLRAILAAGRALETLALDPPLPGDVHYIVTRALAFSSSLRSRYPGRRMPLAPALDPLSTNDDVHRELVACWERVEGLVEASGRQRLLYAPPRQPSDVRTSELAELAAILCDELALLHARHGDPERLPPACHPGIRRTSELHQRVRILGRQLDELLRLSTARPKPSTGAEQSP